MVEASLGASTDDDFFDELFFLLLLLSSSSSHHRHRRMEEFRGQGFLPGGHLLCVCSYVFLMRFLKRLKFLKIQHELSDDSNVIPFTNFNASDLLLTRRVSRTKVVCQKVAQKLPQVCLGFTTLARVSPQSIPLEKVTKKEGKTRIDRNSARTKRRSNRVCDRIKPDPTG